MVHLARLTSLALLAPCVLACACNTKSGADNPDGSGASSSGASSSGGAAGVGGSSTGGTPGSGGLGPSTGGGNSGAGGANDGGTPGTIEGEVYVEPCPESYPGLTSCTSDGATCTYGNTGRFECRARLTCTGGSWTAAAACAPSYPTAACPAEASTGGACEPESVRCAGANGRECSCAMGTWNCDAPVIGQTGCLPLPPNTGTACGTDGTVCQYNRCNVAGTVVGASCQDGVWVASSVSCMSGD